MTAIPPRPQEAENPRPNLLNKLRGFYAASDSWSAMFACRMRFSMSSVFLCTRLKRMVSTGPDNGRYSTSK